MKDMLYNVQENQCISGRGRNYIAELWAMRDGLTLCLNINFPAGIIELDAKAVINVISNPNQPNSIISSNVNDCRDRKSVV